jgi:hypothetical protein
MQQQDSRSLGHHLTLPAETDSAPEAVAEFTYRKPANGLGYTAAQPFDYPPAHLHANGQTSCSGSQRGTRAQADRGTKAASGGYTGAALRPVPPDSVPGKQGTISASHLHLSHDPNSPPVDVSATTHKPLTDCKSPTRSPVSEAHLLLSQYQSPRRPSLPL